MKQVNLRLTELTLAAIDELRGIAARNAWIAQAVDEKIARDSQPILEEEGRRLASRRDDLIASAVKVPEPKSSKAPPINPQARTGGLLQGHPFKAASPGSMRCTCGKMMGAH